MSSVNFGGKDIFAENYDWKISYIPEFYTIIARNTFVPNLGDVPPASLPVSYAYGDFRANGLTQYCIWATLLYIFRPRFATRGNSYKVYRPTLITAEPLLGKCKLFACQVLNQSLEAPIYRWQFELKNKWAEIKVVLK